MRNIKRSVRICIAVLSILCAENNLYAKFEKKHSPQLAHPQENLSQLPVAQGDDQTKLPPCGTTWNNSCTPTSITDSNLTISGSVTLPAGSTHIQACNSSTGTIAVWLGATVTGAAGGSTLLFEAAQEQTILIVVTSDTVFQGSPGSGGSDLLLVFRGHGNIIFAFEDGANLSFTQNGSRGGGTKAFLIMDCPTDFCAHVPTLTFERSRLVPAISASNCDSDTDVTITIGANSLLSYAAWESAEPRKQLTDNGCGVIQFNPNNAGTGRMILDIKDTGAFVVAGCAVDVNVSGDPCGAHCPRPVSSLSLSDFDLATPVFLDARAQVTSVPACSDTRCGGYLLVLNENKTLTNLLVDPWCNLNTRTDQNFVGSFDGIRYGFVIGANGVLDIADGTYLDYVELGKMICPDSVFSVLKPLHDQIKERNPAALIIDGSNAPDTVPATIILGNQSGLFFRSGVDRFGNIENPLSPSPYYAPSHQFTIDFDNRTHGAGSYVLSVEGPLNVFGADVQDSGALQGVDNNSKIEIFSLEVNENSGGLFDCCPREGCYPNRSYAQEIDGDFYRYNRAAFLVNNSMNLFNVTLDHTDENHRVFHNNDLKSEPTYVGGDNLACRNLPTPTLSFINSTLLVQTDIAFTGLDLAAPNTAQKYSYYLPDYYYNYYSDCPNNISRFIFYQNGIQCDQGFGRNMILGTFIGSTACDHCTVINKKCTT